MGSFLVLLKRQHAEESVLRYKDWVRYPSSLRIDPMVLLHAQCIAPIHTRINCVSYQYISSWVGNTGSISEIYSALARN
ncbi:hypothetical protein DPMN_062038 [Dreissena polymorpha]|uniref:Uncharacterized protein n=1 Tax=Dreissena polymorpha TaxID=45954 RepID=A0A9D4C8V7_DREPO|nr:hypothetical protein DPMN_062038 [Dreissena polymorpha]